MKIRLPFIALLAALALVVAACGSDDAEETTTTEAEEPTVLELAVEAGQFSTLIAAIEAAGLGDALSGEGPFTVFAPTDAAFEAAFEALGITPEELLADTETLTAILTYHVLPQEANSQLVATLDGQSVPTLNGQSVAISVQGGQVMVDGATVVSADLEASNGIVHVIDAVLLPPDVAEALGAGEETTTTTTTMAETTTTTVAETTTTTAAETTTTTAAETTTTTEAEAEGKTIAEIVAEAAAADPAEFTILLAALEAADLVDALNNPEDELTVFAPTDDAFEAALDALGITAEELLASEGLADILLYHVLGTTVMSGDILGSDEEEITVETLQGENLVIVVSDAGDVLFRDTEAKVIDPDIEASNGVIHVIDGVLLPPSSQV
jgi:uncharacterized surface protein with fasciclin (FAS1) repeats